MKYCIVGLGQFGSSLAVELAKQKHEVLAIDRRQSLVAKIKDKVSVAVTADASDIEALREVGAHEVDAVAICIGDGFESSLMATLHFKEFGIERIYCRVVNEFQERLVAMLEVTERIQPEAEAAEEFAKRLAIKRAKRGFNPPGEYVVVEVEVPQRFAGKSLAESQLREKCQLNLVTIRNGQVNDDEDDSVCGIPPPDHVFAEGERIIVFGKERDVESFAES